MNCSLRQPFLQLPYAIQAKKNCTLFSSGNQTGSWNQIVEVVMLLVCGWRGQFLKVNCMLLKHVKRELYAYKMSCTFLIFWDICSSIEFSAFTICSI